MKEIRTANGSVVPFIGLGTYPFQGREMAEVVKYAYQVGYRLFDTADDYRGEPGIGMAIKELESEGICKREDIFLQTKISDNNAHPDEPLVGIYFNTNHPFMKRHSVKEIVHEKVHTSLRSMQTSYLDSLLIHYPYPDFYIDIWKEMIQLKNEGKVRYIGVSNFHVRHLEKLQKETGVFPDINEIYISPLNIKENTVSYCHKYGCIPMTYSPLMDIHQKRISKDRLKAIMQKYQKSMAQVILRWNIDRGCFPLPKSKNLERLKENFTVFDFSLSPEEVMKMSDLNMNYQNLVESKICPGL